MSGWFGLDGDSAAGRIKAAGQVVLLPSMMESLVAGWMGFGLVSTSVVALIAFQESWFYRHLGVIGAYGLWTLLFILGAGFLVGRLVAGPGSRRRFYGAFAVAFSLYAAGYVAGYLLLKRPWGEAVGLLVGSGVMGVVLCLAFGARKSLVEIPLVLCAGNMAGYFLGRIVWSGLKGPMGMILGFGVIYGVCVGFALGYSLYACQARLRELLPSPAIGESTPPQE